MENIDMEELLDVDAPAPEAAPAPAPSAPVVAPEEVLDIPVDESAAQPAAPKGKPAKEPKPVKEKPAEAPKPAAEPKPVKEQPAAKDAGGFVLAEGEDVCDSYSFMRGGKVYLTNRRLLFDTYYRADIPVDKVQGVSAVKSSEIRWGKLIFGALFLVLCAACLVLFFKPDLIPPLVTLLETYDWIRWIELGLGILFGIIALALLCKCGRMRFVVNIITDSLEQAVSIRNQGASRSDQYNTVIWAMPGKKRELDRFVRQLGARLIEIKDSRKQ